MVKNENSEVVSLCKAFISQRSYSGEEQDMARELQSYMEANGFVVHVDEYGNVIGTVTGDIPGPTILFDGHMDTVPVQGDQKWESDPFTPEIRDGKLYGRGTTDMKGAIAAMAVAISRYAKATQGHFPGTLCLAGVVHEECFEGVAARKISEYVKPDYVVIGEASQLNVKIGQRGRAEIVVESFGKPCHSANPEKGINAVYKMAAAITALQKMPLTEHPVLGKGILELTDIISKPYPGASVVPEYCRATYDRRLLVGETKESVLAPIQKILDKLMDEDPQASYTVSYAVGKETCYTGTIIEGERFFPGWLFDEQDDYVQAVVNELRASGFTPIITNYNFCTNGSHYAGEKGIKTIGMGPSLENIAHTVNEYVEVEQLEKVTDCYYDIIKALTSLK